MTDLQIVIPARNFEDGCYKLERMKNSGALGDFQISQMMESLIDALDEKDTETFEQALVLYVGYKEHLRFCNEIQKARALKDFISKPDKVAWHFSAIEYYEKQKTSSENSVSA